MWARMMLSEKLNEPTLTVPFGLDELDGPPVDPHEVVTSASATMLAPKTMIRFIRMRALVVDGDGRFYGELDRQAATGDGRVRDRAVRVDASVARDRTLYDAFSQMLIHQASWVAVLDQDRPVGVLTPASFLEAIRNVPAELEGAGATAP